MISDRILNLQVSEKKFNQRLILSDIHLNLKRGELVTLLGASGCGKSTLLRLIAGLDTDYIGEIKFSNLSTHEARKSVGFVFQEPRLLPWLTVSQNIGFEHGTRRLDSTRIAALLQEVGLQTSGNLLPKALSGGMAQRVALARGLYGQPDLLLLDEPFSAVDALTKMKLQDLLLSLAKKHSITVLMVTHDIDEAIYLSDRVLVMTANPGLIVHEVHITEAKPRRRSHGSFNQYRTEIYRSMGLLEEQEPVKNNTQFMAA